MPMPELVISVTQSSPDPLRDRFTLRDLPRIAPWIAEEIAAVGEGEVARALASLGRSITTPQPMAVWVDALKRCDSRFWAIAC